MTNRNASKLTEPLITVLLEMYRVSRSRLFVFDYDGTLMPLENRADPQPSAKVLDILTALSKNNANKIAIVSGRRRYELSKFFAGIHLTLYSDFGASKCIAGQWNMLKKFNVNWKDNVKSILKEHVLTLPYSFSEEKECALVWDYRKCDESTRMLRLADFKKAVSKTMSLNLEMIEGLNSLVIQNIGSGKGTATRDILESSGFDFVLAVGDDDMDEEIFKVLPDNSVTIRIGTPDTCADFFVEDQASIPPLLCRFAEL